MNVHADRFRALGDDSRLRILQLLLQEPLNVGELTHILGVAQPTASKHLAELKRAGLAEKQYKAGFSYYSVPSDLEPPWRQLIQTVRTLSPLEGDQVRLDEILRQRDEYSAADRFVVPGRSWVVWSRALSFLLPSLKAADFGCGDGAFTVEIARWAKRVYAVDSNAVSIKTTREACSGHENVRFLAESMEKTSLGPSSLDVVFVSQSLHYVESPLKVLEEAIRVLKKGARIIVVELRPHKQKWVRQELGHQWLGFSPNKLKKWLRDSGFRAVRLDDTFRPKPATFEPLILTATKPL